MTKRWIQRTGLKSTGTALAVVIALATGANCQAGFLSGILGGKKDDAPEQPPAQATPAADQTQAQRPGRDGKPLPSQPMPDPAVIKAGAQKLKKEMSWEAVPTNLFQQYAGKWNGNFWVYSPLGKLEGKQAVKMECTVQPDGTMQMVTFYHDTISRTWVTHETSIYSVSGDTVNVSISGTRGEPSHQTGHYNDGQLFLVSDSKEGFEHQRERIDGKRFLSDGFAVYNSPKGGKDQHVFIGRLLREN